MGEIICPFDFKTFKEASKKSLLFLVPLFLLRVKKGENPLPLKGSWLEFLLVTVSAEEQLGANPFSHHLTVTL